MNSNTIDKSMNGIKQLTDGEITIEGGSIIFSDGSVLDSIENLTLLNADNVMTGDNTFNNNITAPSVPILNTHLTNKLYVDDAIAAETTSILANDNTFTGTNFFNENVFTLATVPTADAHLTNKSYVDMSIASQTSSLLGGYNTFTGNNTFSNVIVAGTAPSLGTHLTNKSYTDTSIATSITNLKAANNTFTGNNTFDNNITTLAEIPTSNAHLTNKSYVDSEITNETIGILARNNTFTGSNTFSGITKITNTTDGSNTGTGALVLSGGAYVSKHIQLPAATAGIRLGDWNKGICYSNQSSLKIGNDAQYYNISDGIAVYGWVDGCLGTRQTAAGGDKSILYWNSSNRVGINTNSPSYNLDVSGTGRFTNDVSITSTTSSTARTNGALRVSGGVGIAENLNVGGIIRIHNNTNNKKLVLYDDDASEAASTGTTFYGFGMDGSTLRYQTPTSSTTFHKFYNGNNLNLTVGNSIVNINSNLNVNGTSVFEDDICGNSINLTNKLEVGIINLNVAATPIYTGPLTTSNFSYTTATTSSLTISSVTHGYEYAKGTYVATFTTVQPSSGNYGYKVFNNDTTFWESYNIYDIYNLGGSGIYQGGHGTNISGVGFIDGEYLQIQLPYSLIVNTFTLKHNMATGYSHINEFYFLGSNDGTTWNSILLSSIPVATYTERVFSTASNTTKYNYYRLQIKSINYGSDTGKGISLTNFFIYGAIEDTFDNTPYYDNSILRIEGNTALNGDIKVSGITNATTLNVSGATTTGELITDNINGVRVMKSDNGTNQSSIIIDEGTPDLTNLKASEGENFIFGKLNMTSYTGTGTNNTVMGKNNLTGLTTASYNTAMGASVYPLSTSQFNTGMGISVFKATTTGGYNIGIGYNVFKENITGSNNIGIGYLSGQYSLGSQNTFLGNETKTDNNGTYNNSTAIGQSATITASNQIVLGTTGTSVSVVIPSTNSTALTVGGGVSFNSNLTFTTNDSNIRWTNVDRKFKVEAYWSANDRYGLSFNAGGQVRLHISNTYTAGSIAFGRAVSDTTYTDFLKMSYNGDINMTQNLTITDKFKLTGTETDNVFIGMNSQSGTTGNYNVSVGAKSLENVISGTKNTAIGYGAGNGSSGINFNVSGTANTYLGYQTGADRGDYNYSTAVGQGAIITGSSQIRLGTTGTYAIADRFTSTTGLNVNYNTNSGSEQTITIPSFGIFIYTFGANYGDLNIINSAIICGSGGGGGLCKINITINSGFAFTLTPLAGNTFKVKAGYPAGYNNFSITWIKVG